MKPWQLALAFLLSGILWAILGYGVYFAINHWPSDEPIPVCHGKCLSRTA